MKSHMLGVLAKFLNKAYFNLVLFIFMVSQLDVKLYSCSKHFSTLPTSVIPYINCSSPHRNTQKLFYRGLIFLMI